MIDIQSSTAEKRWGKHRKKERKKKKEETT